MTKKIIGMVVVAGATFVLLALAARAEFINELPRYPLYLGIALIVAAIAGIIRDRGERPTIEG
jgi:multidrug transporter EmrE-like cation transporter